KTAATETWTLTVRAGARVEHVKFDALDQGLDALESRATALADDAARQPQKTELKRYSPADQVVARLELAGPERRLPRRHAGIDVHGDGSSEPYVGRVRRRRLETDAGEDARSALRRALTG
ncbi:MAG: hypothetical protein ACRDPA_06130, partial [Solirubrobacteraceae bacterium]